MSDLERQKALAKAKRLREQRLAEATAQLTVCNCMWPLVTLRNGSGHSSTCPAHALYLAKRDDDDTYRGSR